METLASAHGACLFDSPYAGPDGGGWTPLAGDVVVAAGLHGYPVAAAAAVPPQHPSPPPPPPPPQQQQHWPHPLRRAQSDRHAAAAAGQPGGLGSCDGAAAAAASLCSVACGGCGGRGGGVEGGGSTALTDATLCESSQSLAASESGAAEAGAATMDPIIAQILSARGPIDDISPSDELERQRRMYVMLRWSPRYKKLQVQGANATWGLMGEEGGDGGGGGGGVEVDGDERGEDGAEAASGEGGGGGRGFGGRRALCLQDLLDTVDVESDAGDDVPPLPPPAGVGGGGGGVQDGPGIPPAATGTTFLAVPAGAGGDPASPRSETSSIEYSLRRSAPGAFTEARARRCSLDSVGSGDGGVLGYGGGGCVGGAAGSKRRRRRVSFSTTVTLISQEVAMGEHGPTLDEESFNEALANSASDDSGGGLVVAGQFTEAASFAAEPWTSASSPGHTLLEEQELTPSPSVPPPPPGILLHPTAGHEVTPTQVSEGAAPVFVVEETSVKSIKFKRRKWWKGLFGPRPDSTDEPLEK
ncbi:hypothetical protein DFJ73DRAFT_895548 [Zopfochytrium polystomum]|nr:hypothetical protein DFJ73DRAFT_895548 [Zopfochytrium polystomum]